MLIQLNIDDELLRTALRASELPTREAVVEAGLRMVIAQSERSKLTDMLDLLPADIKRPSRH